MAKKVRTRDALISLPLSTKYLYFNKLKIDCKKPQLKQTLSRRVSTLLAQNKRQK